MSINLNDCSPKAPWSCHEAEFPRPEKYGTSQIVRRSRSVNACDTSRSDVVVLCLYSPCWYLTVLDLMVGPRCCVRQFTTLSNRSWVTARFDFPSVSFREELQLLLFLDFFDQRADSNEELRDLLEVVIRITLIRHDGSPERTSSGDSVKASSDLVFLIRDIEKSFSNSVRNGVSETVWTSRGTKYLSTRPSTSLSVFEI